MAKTVTLGGNRLGSGKKQKIELHGYERSTHDLGYLWRSTMSAGTLVPFLSEVALPGDTFDINLNCDIKTHPTIGPLFGSYKVQLDIFQCPVRLYQGQLHNNRLGIGMNMAAIKLPQMTLSIQPGFTNNADDPDNTQINPSNILSYLNIRGIGYAEELTVTTRDFNALPILMYWDIYKNYYANKQEELGAVIHRELIALVTTVTSVQINASTLAQAPSTSNFNLGNGTVININYTGTKPIPDQIIIFTNKGPVTFEQATAGYITDTGTVLSGFWDTGRLGFRQAINWDYISQSDLIPLPPKVATFDLNKIDLMRDAILINTESSSPFIINTGDQATGLIPYTWALDFVSGLEESPYMQNQEGLAIKTYQSDLFNNWLSTEWIDGTGGINEITAIDTSGGSFSIDTLNLSKKVYDMLNRIAVSGGSYDDWLDAVYDHERYQRCETPMYMGGLSKELVFQEVVSNSESNGVGVNSIQPLGTLAGKGVLAQKHKGGQVTIKVDEPSYIMGIVSLTPRIDYSQGNKWDTQLKTMDDFHKPALDEIGFQELIQEQMAWWTTWYAAGTWTTRSAGKQPAWINYMTNVNQVRGNFAIKSNEMFMTLNRRYEAGGSPLNEILDLTTYIDPVKYNQIFAQTAIDAQNFWVQIAVDITARRKMSAKIMPNL